MILVTLLKWYGEKQPMLVLLNHQMGNTLFVITLLLGIGLCKVAMQKMSSLQIHLMFLYNQNHNIKTIIINSTKTTITVSPIKSPNKDNYFTFISKNRCSSRWTILAIKVLVAKVLVAKVLVAKVLVAKFLVDFSVVKIKAFNISI